MYLLDDTDLVLLTICAEWPATPSWGCYYDRELLKLSLERGWLT